MSAWRESRRVLEIVARRVLEAGRQNDPEAVTAAARLFAAKRRWPEDTARTALVAELERLAAGERAPPDGGLPFGVIAGELRWAREWDERRREAKR